MELLNIINRPLPECELAQQCLDLVFIRQKKASCEMPLAPRLNIATVAAIDSQDLVGVGGR